MLQFRQGPDFSMSIGDTWVVVPVQPPTDLSLISTILPRWHVLYGLHKSCRADRGFYPPANLHRSGARDKNWES